MDFNKKLEGWRVHKGIGAVEYAQSRSCREWLALAGEDCQTEQRLCWAISLCCFCLFIGLAGLRQARQSQSMQAVQDEWVPPLELVELSQPAVPAIAVASEANTAADPRWEAQSATPEVIPGIEPSLDSALTVRHGGLGEVPKLGLGPGLSAAVPFRPDAPEWFAENDERRTPPPPYPAQLQLRGVAGEVEIWFRVDRDGRTWDVNLKQSSGSRELDRIGVEWVERRWRFEAGKERFLRVRLRWKLVDAGKIR